MAFTPEEIRNAWEDSLANGFSPEQVYQGALANFGLTREQVDAALAQTSGTNVQQMFLPKTVQTNVGEFSYDDIVNQINARYAEGKTPDLAVKSALQLGITPDIIALLPGVDAEALAAGKALIDSGAFANTATGTSADIQTAAPVGSEQYNARLAAGLDAFGFPPEEVAKLTAAGLYGPGKQYDPGTTASGGLTAQELSEAVANIGDMGSYSFFKDGTAYIVKPDGTYETTTNLPNNRIAYQSFDSGGNLVNQYEYTDKPSWQNSLFNAATGALIASVLGPAGAGLLGGTAAAAAGAGAGSLVGGGSIEDALKAAALGGTAAYGLGQLFPYGAAANTDAAFIAADAAQLAGQGLGADQISQVLQASGVAPAVAANVAASAAEGLNPQQIINDIGNISFGSTGSVAPTVDVSSAVDPNQVLVTGSNVGTGALSGVAPLLGTIVPSLTLPQVTVTGQSFTTPDTSLTSPEVIGSVLPVVSGGTVQQVGVEGTKIPTQESIDSSVLGSIIPGITPSIPTAVDKVEVTGQKVPDSGIDTSGLGAIVPSIAPVVSDALPKPVEAPKQDDKINTDMLNNVVKLIGLLTGGSAVANAGSGTGTGIGSIPTSNPFNYDDDYFSQIQKYYNSYMPQYPRDVATPLRQWYGNDSMGQGMLSPSSGMSTPGSVFNTLFADLGLNKEN